MTLLRKVGDPPARLAILPGTFNPPTRAHLALAAAALPLADQVLLALPRQLPHKPFAGFPFEARVEMLLAAAGAHPRFAVGVSEGGLLLEIAREVRAIWPASRIAFLCGRDAAERIVNWDYASAPPFEQQLEEFSLVVAARQGTYCPPPELADRIQLIAIDPDYDWHSATVVRTRIAVGQEWRHLVPPAVIPVIERYSGLLTSPS